MNYFSNFSKLFGSTTREDRRCEHCHAQPKFISKMMDPRRGKKPVRIYECSCGQQTWLDDPR